MHSEVRLQHRHKPPHQEEQHEQKQKTDSGLIFVVFLVLRKGKRTSASERESDGREPRKKQRYGLGILVERGTVMLAKLCFFPTHDDRIKQRKIAAQNDSRYPGVRGDGGGKRKNEAAEIQRIPRVGVGPGHGQNFLLVKMAGGAGTDE